MPWTLIILVAGLVLRFGIDGYNTLGDILIAVSVVLAIIVIVFGMLTLAVISSKEPNKPPRRRWPLV